MNRLAATFFATLTIGLAQPVWASTALYNLSSDWSNTQNPNGTWALNSGSTAMTNFHDIGVTVVWDIDGSTNPSWVKRTQGDTNWNDVQVGDIVPQAWWFGSDRTNVTWTSPLSGYIEIAGRSWDAFGANRLGDNRDGDWVLAVNGTPIAQRNSISELTRNQVGANFADNLIAGMALSSINVNPGDIVNFSVGGRSTSGVELNITLTDTATVPIPSAIWLFSSVLASFGFIGKHRLSKIKA